MLAFACLGERALPSVQHLAPARTAGCGGRPVQPTPDCGVLHVGVAAVSAGLVLVFAIRERCCRAGRSCGTVLTWSRRLQGRRRLRSSLCRKAADEDAGQAKEGSEDAPATTDDPGPKDPLQTVQSWWDDFWFGDYWNQPIAVDATVLTAGTAILLTFLSWLTVNIWINPAKKATQERLDRMPLVGLNRTYVKDPSRYENANSPAGDRVVCGLPDGTYNC
eukprot:TRINITY_DN24148_c0_g1_i1.p1 TRINITY_DN24148_c0_g1~~TRINITY_DN24148_c0_g1_i1.p1  ORF type:complete len:220 (-),score=23.98 TRINITY_DN24148_c0_g1_i1:70-729(-)